jgi:four helix bundle protein
MFVRMALSIIKNNLLWLNAVKTVEDIYFVTKGFPADDEKEMRYQMRKDSVSITLNIAKAVFHTDPKMSSRPMRDALRACSSLLKCLIICRSYGWICPEEFMALINRIDKQVSMIYRAHYKHKRFGDRCYIDHDFKGII